jgi:sugar phosphate isomerase/epimerase
MKRRNDIGPFERISDARISATGVALTAVLYDDEGDHNMPAAIRLGYDTYSIRNFRIKALEHLEYSAKLGLDTIQISSVGDYESLDPAHLEKVKRRAAELGITIDAGTGCICSSTRSWNPKQGDPAAYLTQGLRVAKAVGATSLRCFMGSAADRRGDPPIDLHMENTVRVFKAVRPVALDAGVRIGLENHGDMQAWELKTVIEEAGKDYVGACLDAGNPIQTVEDPLVSMEILGPYAVTTHVRDSIVYEHPRGAAWQWVAMGDGVVDLQRWVELHRKLCPNASMQLEIITGRPPQVLPYLDPGFWKAFPKARGAEFARFVGLVKRGHPFEGSMVMEDAPAKKPPEFQAALNAQQKVDLERSLEYSKKVLGAGLKGRG